MKQGLSLFLRRGRSVFAGPDSSTTDYESLYNTSGQRQRLPNPCTKIPYSSSNTPCRRSRRHTTLMRLGKRPYRLEVVRSMFLHLEDDPHVLHHLLHHVLLQTRRFVFELLKAVSRSACTSLICDRHSLYSLLLQCRLESSHLLLALIRHCDHSLLHTADLTIRVVGLALQLLYRFSTIPRTIQNAELTLLASSAWSLANFNLTSRLSQSALSPSTL